MSLASSSARWSARAERVVTSAGYTQTSQQYGRRTSPEDNRVIRANGAAFGKSEVGAFRDLGRPAVEVGDDERARCVKADALDRLRVDTRIAQNIVRGFADSGPDISRRLLKDAVVLRIPVRDGLVGRLGTAPA